MLFLLQSKIMPGSPSQLPPTHLPGWHDEDQVIIIIIIVIIIIIIITAGGKVVLPPPWRN